MGNSIDFIIRTVWQSSGMGSVMRDQNALEKSIKNVSRAHKSLAGNKLPANNMMNNLAKTTSALQGHNRALQQTLAVYNNTRTGAVKFSTDLDRVRKSLTTMSGDFAKARAQIGTTGKALTDATLASSQYTASINKVIQTTAGLERARAVFSRLENDTRRLTAANKQMADMWGKGQIPSNVQSQLRRTFDQVLNVARKSRGQIEKERILVQAELAKMQNILAQTGAARRTAIREGGAAKGVGDTQGMQKHAADLERLNAVYSKQETSLEQLARKYDQLGASLDRATVNEREAGTSLANLTGMMQANGRGAQMMSTAWQTMSRVMASVRMAAASIATTLGSVLSSALNTSARAVGSLNNVLGRFGTSAAAGFARLRSSLDGTGRAFLGFGRTVQSSMGGAQRQMNEFLSAGWSLLGSGSMIRNYGRMGTRMLGGAAESYIGVEDQLLRAGVAGDSWFNPRTGQSAANTPGYARPGDTSALEKIVLDLQSGRYSDTGPALSFFTAEELGEQLYILTSSLGIDLKTQGEAAAAALAPLASLAKYTQTSPETAYKGVINALLEFGYDPRKIIKDASAAADPYAAIMQGPIGKVAGQFGLLANISTMEIPDIAEMFKMTGPLVNQLYGGEAGAGLTDTMVAAFMASEAGMRGGQVGRGVSMLMSSLLDPQGPAVDALKEVFGETATFANTFFKPDGTLMNGLEGVFSTIASSGADTQSVAKLIAEMFTQNVTRTASGISGQMFLDPAKWQETYDLLEDRPEEFLSNAILAMEGTVSAGFMHVKSAWDQVQMSIVAGVRGPLIDALRSVGDVLFDVAYAFRDNPALAAFIARVVAFGAIAASVTGSLLVFTGAMLLLVRAFSMMGGAVSSAMGLFTLIPSLIAGSIVPILFLATAIGGLFLAWNSNTFGMKDAWTSFVDNLSIEFVVDKLESLALWIRRIGSAFQELVMGIFLGQGSTNNLAALIDTVFGLQSGNAIMTWIRQFGGALSGIRENIKDFFTDLEGTSVGVSTFVEAFRGLVDGLIFGAAVFSSSRMTAMQDVLNMFGIEISIQQIMKFYDALNKGFNQAIGVVRGFGAEVRTEFQDIGENLLRIVDNLGGFFNLISSFAGGVFVGFLNSLVRFLDLVDAITNRIASASDSFQNWAATTEGVRGRMSQLAEVLGFVVGTLLGSRLIVALVPGVALLTRFGLLVASSAVALTIFGARLALAVVQMTLFAAASAVSAFAGFVAFLITTPLAFLALGVAIAVVLGYFDDMDLSMDNIVSTLREIVSVAIEVGTGFVGAFATAYDIIVTVVDAINSLLRALDSAGIISFTSSLQGLGFVLGGVFLGSLLAGIPGVIALGSAIAGLLPKLGSLFTLLGSGLPGGKWGFGFAAVMAVGLQALEEPIQGIIEGFGVATDKANDLANAITNIGTAAAVGFMVGGPIGALIAGGGMGAYELYQSGALDPDQGKEDWRTLQGSILASIPPQSYGPPIPAGLVTQEQIDTYRSTMGGTGALLDNNAIRDLIVETRQPEGPSPYQGPDPFTAQGIVNGIFKEFGRTSGTTISSGTFQLPRTLNPKWRDEIIGTAAESTGIPRSSLDSMYSARAMQSLDEQVRVLNPYRTNAQGQVVGKDGVPQQMYSPSSLQGGDMAVDNAQMLSVADIIKQNTQVAMGQLDESTSGSSSLGRQINKIMNKFLPEFDDSLMDITKMMGMDIAKGDFTPDIKAAKKMMTENFSEFSKFFGPEAEAMAEAIFSGDEEAIKDAVLETQEKRVKNEKDLQEMIASSYEALADMDMVNAAKRAFEPIWEAMSLPVGDATGGPMPGFVSSRPKGYVSAGAAVMTHAETILGNLKNEEGENMAPWMNEVELLMDLAVGGQAGMNVQGKNLQTALAGPLQALSQQTGIGIEALMEGVPKFFADQTFVPAAAGMLAAGLAAVPDQATRKAIDLFGQAQGLNEYGTEWVDVVDFAISNAAAGKDWNFANFVAESYGVSLAKANQMLADAGIDPEVISEALFPDLQLALDSQGGQLAILTDDTLKIYEENMGRLQDGVLSLTREQFDSIPDAVKRGLAQQGTLFHIQEVDVGVNTTVQPPSPAELAVDRSAIAEMLAWGGVDVGIDVTPVTNIVDVNVEEDRDAIREMLSWGTVDVPIGVNPVFSIGDGTGGPGPVFGDGTGGPAGWGLPPIIVDQPYATTFANQTSGEEAAAQVSTTVATLIPKSLPTITITQKIAIQQSMETQAHLTGAGPFSVGGGAKGFGEVVVVTASLNTSLFDAKMLEITSGTWTVVLTADNTQAASVIKPVIDDLNTLATRTVTPTVLLNAPGVQAQLDGILQTLRNIAVMRPAPTVTISVVGREALNSAYNTLNAMPSSKTTSVYVNTYATRYENTVGVSGVSATNNNILFPFAEGGTVTSKWAVVGELGPELVQMPYGSTVYDAGRSQRMVEHMQPQPLTSSSFNRQTVSGVASGGGERNLNIGTINVNDRADADYLLEKIDRHLGTEMDREVHASRKSTYGRRY